MKGRCGNRPVSTVLVGVPAAGNVSSQAGAVMPRIDTDAGESRTVRRELHDVVHATGSKPVLGGCRGGAAAPAKTISAAIGMARSDERRIVVPL